MVFWVSLQMECNFYGWVGLKTWFCNQDNWPSWLKKTNKMAGFGEGILRISGISHFQLLLKSFVAYFWENIYSAIKSRMVLLWTFLLFSLVQFQWKLSWFPFWHAQIYLAQRTSLFIRERWIFIGVAVKFLFLYFVSTFLSNWKLKLPHVSIKKTGQVATATWTFLSIDSCFPSTSYFGLYRVA